MSPRLLPARRRPSAARTLEILLLVVVFCFLAGTSQARDRHDGSQPKSEGASSKIKMDGLPIVFEPNLQQADSRYRFITHQNGLAIGFLDRSLEIRLATKDGGAKALQIAFEGAATGTASGEQLLPGRVNYLRGNDPSAYRRGIPTYAQVRYSSLYPGTDLVFYGNGTRIEHDFVLAPGANPKAIAMRFSGGGDLVLTPEGTLRIGAQQGAIEFHKPVAYQETTEGRVEVAAAFRLAGSRVGFEVGKYDRSFPLVIDPVLDYSTYLADASVDLVTLTADAAGNSYIAGLAFDPAYPVTPGAFQTTCAGCGNTPDVFVTKLSADGSGQVYSTFLGGTGYDQANGVAVDSSGNAIVIGFTQSQDFPLKNSVTTPTVGPGSSSAFVTSLSADGSALNYSSLLGSNSAATAVAVDANGNAFVAGTTSGSDFPVTPGALNAPKQNVSDGRVFVTRLLPAGALGYSALIGNPTPQNGGAGPTGASSIAVDANGNAYVYGRSGILWPVTPGAFQSTVPGPSPFAAPFVSKVAPDGASLVYSTFVGNGFQTLTMALNSNGEAILTGLDPDPSYPVTPDALVSSLPPFVSGAWLTKLNSTGTGLVYSSFLTSGDVSPRGLTLDPTGNIWIVGRTSDAQFPLIHPFQSFLPISNFSRVSGFIQQFDPTGKQLLFSTYFGSATQFSEVDGIAADAAGKIHITGVANVDLQTTPGSFHPTVTPKAPATSGVFGFAAKIDPSAAAPAMCLPKTVSFGLNFFTDTTVGQSTTTSLAITNCGTQPLLLASVQSDSPLFTIDQSQCVAALAPNDSCNLSVTFTPVSPVFSTANLRLTFNTPMPLTVLPMSAQGVVPVINVFGSPIFDPVLVGQPAPPRTLFLENIGGAPLHIDVAHTTITGDFTLDLPDCNAPVIGNTVCLLTVKFTPQAAGTRTGTLTIVSDDPVHPVLTIPASGVGVATYPVPAITSLGSPTMAVGSSNPRLFVIGTNFFPTSVVRIAGQPQATTYQSFSGLSVAVDPALLTSMSELPVTVVNPSPGGGESAPATLTVYQKLLVDPTSVVAVPLRNLLYASVPSSATSNPNSVIPIDPSTGNTLTPIAVGKDPQALAASDDGTYLYVGSRGDQVIQRIDLNTGAVDRTFPYPPGGLILGNFIVSEMHTVPGSPKSLLVALGSTGGVGGVVALYNDGGLVNSVPDLTQFFGGVDVSDFAFTDPSTAYSLPFTSATPFFNIFKVDAAGLHFTPVTGNNAGGNNTTGFSLISDGTLLYTKAGQVWDPVSKTQVGTFPVLAINPTSFPNLHDMVMDKAKGQFFMVADQTGNGSIGDVLTAYDLKSLAVTATVEFPDLNDALPHNLVRWGANGFAFISTGTSFNDTALYILRSSIASNSVGPAVTLSGTAVSFGSFDAGVASPAQVLTITNSGNAPLNISKIVATGDFSVTHTCSAPVAAGTSCNVSITFKPSVAGARTGLLTITDDALNGQQVVALSGTGTTATISIAPAGGGSTTATVTAGQAATYNLSLAGSPGAAGTATLSCTGAPVNAACTVAPSALALSSGTNAPFSVTVATQVVRTASISTQTVTMAGFGLTCLFLLPVLMTRRSISYRVRGYVLLLACVPLLMLSGCGGGGGSSTAPPTQQFLTTAPGTYTLTITATTSTATVSQQLTLTVH